MDVKAKLTQKFGPLPVWGWGAIVGIVALVAYYLIYSRSGGANVRAGAATTTGSTIDPSGYQTAGIRGGSASVSDITIPDNNMTWLAKTSKLVAANLAGSPTDVYNALKKFLQGTALTVDEKKWIDAAVQYGGTPPEGTQGISDIIPPDDAVQNPNPAAPKPIVNWFMDGDNRYGGGKQYIVSGPGIFEITKDTTIANSWARLYGDAKKNLTYAEIDAAKLASKVGS